jgi:Isopenicillin N synthase and related dioxygenases
LGKNLLSNDPYVVERRFGQAPNKYPAEVPDPQLFARVMEDYHSVMSTFAKNLLHVLSCTLDLKADFFDDFCDHPVAVLRLLHYPPQDPTTVENERGEFPNKVTDYFPQLRYTDCISQVSGPTPTSAQSRCFSKTIPADYKYGTTPHLNGSMLPLFLVLTW